MTFRVNIVKAGWLWLIGGLALFFYSFTQIDLGLTLTRASWWQTVQRAFQQIGYFQRPLSTILYLLILGFLFVFYFLLIRSRGEYSSCPLVPRKGGWATAGAEWLGIWPLIFLTVAILGLAYNAFSYDLFNYIFDAKIVTFYHQNPFQHKALDYPADPMLGFMHWTHRTFPYGPIWLLVSLPISLLGFGKLLPTMILFKALAVASYLGACWLVWKLAVADKKVLAFFAFSPLVVVETLVSGHHDLLMMALVLAGFYCLQKKRLWLAWLMLGLSIGIKFATGFLVPVFLWVSWRQYRGKKVAWSQVWWLSFGLMVMAMLMAVYRAEHLMPWYFLYAFPFAALLAKNWLFWLVGIFSLGLLLTYAPFLYYGHWDPPVSAINNGLIFGSLVTGFVTLTFGKNKG